MTIVNISEICPSVIKEFFDTEEFEFFLTGSRYFGTSTPGSDWDFFVEDTPDVIAFLEGIGFELQTDKEYSHDRVTVNTYRLQNVEVQLVSDVGLKKRAQFLLKRYSYIGHDNTLTR